MEGGLGYQAVGNSVMRVATSGAGSPVTIYDGTSSPWGTPTGIALDASYAYITTAQRRLLLHVNVTAHPHAAWAAQ